MCILYKGLPLSVVFLLEVLLLASIGTVQDECNVGHNGKEADVGEDCNSD